MEPTSTTDMEDWFKCPISLDVMTDPVVISSGQTYDRKSINMWHFEGNLKCPTTNLEVAYPTVTPNILVREMISFWCNGHGIVLESIAEEDQNSVFSLVKNLTSSLANKKDSAKKLRRITKTMPRCREMLSESTDSISALLDLLPLTEGHADPELEEDFIATILNISTEAISKKFLGEHPGLISLLTNAMKFGRMGKRRNAAATLLSLSALDSNRVIIGNYDTLKNLLQLLHLGHPLVIKDVVAVLYNLCLVNENREKLKELDGMKIIQEKKDAGILEEELSRLLKLMSSEIGNLSTLPTSSKAADIEESLQLDHSDAFVEKFKCPMSGNIMAEPVILASGQTCDRSSIEKWLNEGNLTCPRSKEVLLHTLVTPNHLVRKLICDFYTKSGTSPPARVSGDNETSEQTLKELNSMMLHYLAVKVSSSPSNRKEAVKAIHKLACNAPQLSVLFCRLPNAITNLVGPEVYDKSDPSHQFHLTSTVLRLSMYEENKSLLGKNEAVIPMLSGCLNSRTEDIKTTALKTLCMLSTIEANNRLIGESDVLYRLLNLLIRESDTTDSYTTEVQEAISVICALDDNKVKMTAIGAVRRIVHKVKTDGLKPVLVRVLALLSTHYDAACELIERDFTHYFQWAIRYSTDRQSDKIYEHILKYSVEILYNICMTDDSVWERVSTEESREPGLRHFLKSKSNADLRDTKKKAKTILKLIHSDKVCC